MKRFVTTPIAALAIGSAIFAAAPARADDSVAQAGFSNFALGALFPFINGYEHHQSGYWYVRDPRYYRYPVEFYKWYAPAQGYIYVGPNWQQWQLAREQVYAAPPYFTVPPKRYVYYPPVPYYYGQGYLAGQAPAYR